MRKREGNLSRLNVVVGGGGKGESVAGGQRLAIAAVEQSIGRGAARPSRRNSESSEEIYAVRASEQEEIRPTIRSIRQ